MHRKVSFKDGSRHRFHDDRGHGIDRGSFRLSEQKLATVRDIIRQQQSVGDFRFSHDARSSNYKSAVDEITAPIGDAVQSNVTLRKLHHASDPIAPLIPMASSSGGNVFTADGEALSPVRSRKIARKMASPDEEENLPATPLLPGKIRVESLKVKPKKDAKVVGKTAKVNGAPPPPLQKSSTMPASRDASKKTGLMELAMSAPIPGDNEGAKAKKGPSEKRIRNEEDIRAYKHGLEVAWQVIGPPPVQAQNKTKKSPDLNEAKTKQRKPDIPGKKAAAKSAPVPQPSKDEPVAAITEKSTGGEEEEVGKSIEISTEDASKDQLSIDESRLPPAERTIAQDLKAALAMKDDESAASKLKDLKAKSAPPIKGTSKPTDDKKPKEPPCPRKSRAVTDKEAIQSYIKQQRLARSSAEQQRRAEQARLEREKQARLQALYEHQQAVARIPVRNLLPETHHAPPPRISLRLPSSFHHDDEGTSESVDQSSIPVVIPSVENKSQPTQEKTAVVEPKSTVATIATALVPDAGRTERVCAILQSALSLQVKLRAEVDRVERYIASRSGGTSAAQVQPATLKTPISVTKFDQAHYARQHSPSFLHELSGVSTSTSPPALTVPQPTVRDSSTSPVFTSPGKREPSTSPSGSQLDRTITPQSPSKQVRLMTPELPSKDQSSVSTSPLSTAPVDKESEPSRENSVLSNHPLLPVKNDPWNVASVLRRSFGIGTTPGRGLPLPPAYADAELQTTFFGSPPRFTSDVGVQSVGTETIEDGEGGVILTRSRPDLVEACIQTATPIKSLVEDVTSDEPSSLSLSRMSPPKQSQRVAEILREEAENERVAPEVLDAQLHAELDLLASLDGYHRQLDDLERMRTNAEQNTDVAGLVTLMNAVESHVRETLQTQPVPAPSSPPNRPKSGGSSRKVEKEHTEPPPPPPQPVIVQQQVVQQDSPSLTALELRQDIERRFQALEAATGRRLAEDSERLLEAHLRTSIAVSDLTRQLADMQRQSLLSLQQPPQRAELQTPPPPPQPTEPQVRYHRRQTFSPPRPPPLPHQPAEEQSALTVPSEIPIKSAGSTTAKSIEEEEVSSALSISEEEPMKTTPPESPKPTDQSMVRKAEDHKMLCEIIAQQARQSSLRFRADIAELTLREREAKKRANQELGLIEKRRKILSSSKNPEAKLEMDRLTALKGKVLAAYAKEKKHLESLKRSSTRLASEQKSLADQLRRSLPADFPGAGDESLGLDDTETHELDHDLSLQLQAQFEQLAGDEEDKLSKSVVEQFLTGREQMLEERQTIAEQMLARKAQLDAKEEEVRQIEERLARELATPKRMSQPAVVPTKQPQLLSVPKTAPPRAVSAEGRTDDDAVSLPESLGERNQATTPGSTTAPPIPSSSIAAGLGEILALERREEESVAEVVQSSAKSTTPAATVVSEEAEVVEEVATEIPGDDYADDDFEPERSITASSVATEKTPSVPPVDTKRVETLRDELAEKRQQVRELKIARDEIKRKREMERVRAKESHLASKLSQKDEEIRKLEDEIANLQAASIRSESKQSISEVVESIPIEAEEEEIVVSPLRKAPSVESVKSTASRKSVEIRPDSAKKIVSEVTDYSEEFEKTSRKSELISKKPVFEIEPVKSIQEEIIASPVKTASEISEEAEKTGEIGSVVPENEPNFEMPSAMRTATEVSEDVLVTSTESKKTPEPVKPQKPSVSDVTEADESLQFDSEAKPSKVEDDEEENDNFFISEVKLPNVEPVSSPGMQVETVEKEEEPPARPESRLSDHEKSELSESVQKSEVVAAVSLEEDVEPAPEDDDLDQVKKMEEALREIDEGDDKEPPSYSEEFSASTSQQLVSASKDFEVAEELSESVDEPEDDEEEEQTGGTFLDLGATLAMPDKTPVSSSQLDATYTVSSAASGVSMSEERPTSPDATPKLPTRRNRNDVAGAVAEEVFPDLVKEAVDSAVLTVKMSPKKKDDEDETSPVKMPLPPDFEGVEKEEDPDFYDDDMAFDKVAEVASRLRSMAGGAATLKPVPEPAPAPFLVPRRQQLPNLVRQCVEFLWRQRNENRSVEDAVRPEEIYLEKASPNQSDEVTSTEAEFSNLVFDTAKYLFRDLFSKGGGKIVPTNVDDVYRAVLAQMAPFVGLPGGSNGIPHRVQFATVGRRRDAVDEVLLSELYSEPSDNWCDFTQDEEAVREEVVASLMSSLVDDLMTALEPFFPPPPPPPAD